MQFLDYAELGRVCKEIDLDGVDLTVRPGGHVLPENVASDLPKAVDAVRNAGLDVYMITTGLADGEDPTAKPILEAASKLGIKYFRAGGTARYDYAKPILPQLEELAAGLSRLAKVAEEYDMTAGYHNHSGPRYIGGALWDLHRVYEMVNSPRIGSNLDAGHIVAEGRAGAWEPAVNLIAPYTKMMAVKDFRNAEDGKPEWVRFGDGIVDTTKILSYVREAGFAGPVSIHVEYHPETDAAMIEEVRESGARLRKCIADAGYA
jgi:sugar phosphate isomerase/epimerase